MKTINKKKYIFLLLIIILVAVVISFIIFSKRAFSKSNKKDIAILQPAPDNLLNPQEISYPQISKNGEFSYLIDKDGNLHILKDEKEYVVLSDGTILEVMPDGSYKPVDEKTKSEILEAIKREMDGNNTALSNYFLGNDENFLDKQINLKTLSDEKLEGIASKLGVDKESLVEYMDKLNSIDKETLKNMTDEELKEYAEEIGVPYDILKAYQENLKNGRDSFTLQDLEEVLLNEEERKEKLKKEKTEALQNILDTLGITDITAEDVLKKLEEQGISFAEFTQDIAKNGASKALENIGYNLDEKYEDDSVQKALETQTVDPFTKALETWANKDDKVDYSGLSNVLSVNGSESYSSQNGQNEKKSFIAQTRKGYSQISYSKKDNMVLRGSLIKATLVNGINSDIPGEVYAIVSENVYDGFYQNNILIPKGSILQGVYDSSVSWGQNSIIISWVYLRRPDGFICQLNGYQSTDKMGFAGSSGQVDSHIGSIVGASVLSSLIKYGASSASSTTDIEALAEAISNGSSSISTVANKYLEKAINRQPTIKMNAGDKIIAMATDDIEMPYWETY